MENNIYDTVIEELLCPICIDCFDEPVMLNCYHTFCRKCVSIFFKFSKKRYRWKIVCPICRALTILNCAFSENPTKLLHKNYIVLGLVSKMSKIKQSSEKKNDLDSALNNQGMNEDENVFCKLHKKNMVKYFCKNCNSLVCRVCTILNHREHQLVFPHEIVISHQEDIESRFLEIQSNDKTMCIALSTLDITMAEIRSRYNDIIEQINKTAELRSRLLIEKKNELYENLNKIVHNKIKKLMVQKDQIEFEYGKSKISFSNTDSILANGTAIDKLRMKSLMDEQLGNFSYLSLEPEEDDTIIYEIPEDAIDKLVESMGAIIAKSTFADISFAYGDNLEIAKTDAEAHFKVVACSKTGHPNSANDTQISVQINTPNGLPVISRINYQENGEYSVTFVPKVKGKHKIEVNLRGRPIQKSPFICTVVCHKDYSEVIQPKIVFGIYGSGQKEFKSPLGVAADKHGFLYVSDCYNHRLQIFGSKGECISTYGSQGCRKGCFSNPSGITYCPKTHRLFVCDTGNSQVQIFSLKISPDEESSTGNWCIGKIGGEGAGLGGLKSPSGVAISSQNQDIAVCDPGNNCVQFYNLNGIFLSRLGGPNQNIRNKSDMKLSLNSPSHAAFEPEKNLLYISDTKNNRIIIFDRKSNRLVRKIESSPAFQLLNPKGLAFDQANNLIIVNSGLNTVNVMSWEGKLIQTFGSNQGSCIKFSFPESVCVLPN
ncbi:hypothetical protein MXB_53, partial [Myxobolus squamalis]